ncbi:MAG TPA: choice-of-anchor tandem repeat GloVer-containing protein [Rhizomicrobium sp.]|nr:choice-of-anchor tandem repeat GloVer-containing protein [Rhizomicrobium sp.]
MSEILDFSAKCFVGCGLALAMFGPSAHAKGHDKVLYSFCSQQDCADGSGPEGGVIADSAGNLYGTTSVGGANGGGSVFEIAPDGTYSVLYSFCSRSSCADGENPSGSLTMDGSGNLYGATTFGGTRGAGVVFELAANGTETVLYTFCLKNTCRNGANPASGVIIDGSGDLYGTTTDGGNGSGTVFRLAASGGEKVLYKFRAGNDGFSPSSLVMDDAGNLYGTAQGGGPNGAGDVFEVTPNGAYKQLYDFCIQPDCADGANPLAGLILDGSGNLYGTTSDGGTYGLGTVFKLAADGSETVLYSFCSRGDCSDGAYPAANLTMDGSGNLYGTTQYGDGRDCYDIDNGSSCGAVFRLAPNGTETALYSFCSKAACADGAQPEGNLILDSSGNLYGTTYIGGTGHCVDGCGTIFKLDAGGSKRK